MKVVHWSLGNGSGMANVAASCAESERRLGLDASVARCDVEDGAWEAALDADVHVSHTHVPDRIRRRFTKPLKLVAVFHGTPEHVYAGAVEAGEHGRYAPSNALMLMQHDLQCAHARVTFWERHAAIYRTMVDWGTTVHCVPMGVDRAFWAAGASRGKYAGTPSVWTGENQHAIKWVLDLALMWPWIAEAVEGVCLHACYNPFDQHRYLFPLVHRNQAYYTAHFGAWTYPHDELRNIWKSVDFFIGLVRYGDANRLCLEANAAGAPTISYRGNPYSSYWVPEGDQRETAKEVIRILRGEVEPRADRRPVPDMMETAAQFQAIYEGILPRSDAPKALPTAKRTARRRA